MGITFLLALFVLVAGLRRQVSLPLCAYAVPKVMEALTVLQGARCYVDTN